MVQKGLFGPVCPFWPFLATCDPLNPCGDFFLAVFALCFHFLIFCLPILSRNPLISRFWSIIWSKKAFFALFAHFWPFLATCDPINLCRDFFLAVFALCFHFSIFTLLILSRKPLISRFWSIIWSKKALFAPFCPFLPISGRLWPLEHLYGLFPGCICVLLLFFKFYFADLESKPVN